MSHRGSLYPPVFISECTELCDERGHWHDPEREIPVLPQLDGYVVYQAGPEALETT